MIKQTKKLGTILVVIAMLTALVIPAIAAETSSGTASTLRLESVDGTAGVKNASGKALTSRSGMRLYSGYEIATEKASYAYFSLDSTKAVKMDASSKGEVFQSGKKLELKLTAGSLFFDVSAPVKSNESMTIRTSTMVTGVRGTSGWVEIVDRYTTRFSLLEGELEIVSIDPLTSNERSITIVGGQTATVVYHGEMNDYVTDLFVERLTIQKLAEAGVILDMDVLGEMIAAGIIPEDATLQELINSGLILDEDALHDLLAEGGMDEETIQQLLESGMLPEDVTIEKLIQEGTIREEHIILDGTGLTVEELQEEDVPGYVAVEVEKNEELQQRIEETTQLDVEEIISDAEEKLAEEEAADEAADQTIQEAFETLTAEDTDPLFEEEVEESTSGSSSSSGGSVNTYILKLTNEYYDATGNVTISADTSITTLNEGAAYTITTPAGYSLYSVTGDPTVVISGDTATGTMDTDKEVIAEFHSTTIAYLDGPTVAELNGVFANYPDISTVNVTGWISTTNAVQETATVPSNVSFVFLPDAVAGGVSETVILDSEANSQIIVEGGATVTNNGVISGEATMTVKENATLTNNGTINVENTNSMHVYGTLSNATSGSTINVGSNHSGTIKFGALVFEAGSTITNIGTVNIRYGSFFVKNSFTNLGMITIASAGEATLASGVTLTNTFDPNIIGGTSGIIETNSLFTIAAGASLINNGTFGVMGTGTLMNQGTFTNNDLLSLNTTEDGTSAAVFINDGECTVGSNGRISEAIRAPGYYSIITNNGIFRNESVNFSPGGSAIYSFVNNGEYIDVAHNDDLYVMGVDANHIVKAFDTAANVFGGAWQAGVTYTLFSCETTSPTSVTPTSLNVSDVTLDLNGYTITLADTLTISGGSLTITDSSVEGGGCITNRITEDTINMSNGAKLFLEKGILENGYNVGYAIRVTDGKNNAVSMIGGAINSTACGIRVEENVTESTVNMSGGTIEVTNGDISSAVGIHMLGKAMVTVSGGTINCPNSSNGSAILLLKGTVTINGTAKLIAKRMGVQNHSSDLNETGYTVDLSGTATIQITGAGSQYVGIYTTTGVTRIGSGVTIDAPSGDTYESGTIIDERNGAAT